MEKIEKILEKIAQVEEIQNYEIKGDANALRGDGFIGEFYSGSVTNKETGETIYTYIKTLPKSEDPYAPSAFFNEFHFYENIVPELKKFLKERNVKTPFTNIPRFYCAGNEPGEEYISMENLKIQNYDILDKSKSINGEFLKVIFDKYGKYHALTFAFKDQNPEKHRELVSPLRDVYVEFAETGRYLFALKGSFHGSYSALKERDEDIAKKILPYLENITEHYKKIMVYDGQHSALVHGDCWSNNLLFKFTVSGLNF